MLNLEQIRKDFPILNRKVHGKQLVYFDNGATSQKPRQVINELVDYYENYILIFTDQYTFWERKPLKNMRLQEAK